MDGDSTALELTFDEANILFGHTEINPATVLKSLYAKYNPQFQSTHFNEFRILLIGTCILARIKDENTRYLVRILNSTFIKEQFRGKHRINCNLLHYLFSLTWHFRNCRNFNDIETAGRNQIFISKIKKKLISAGISVQLEFSFQ